MTASYMLKHNFFMDAKLIVRRQQSSLLTQNTAFASLNLRWNIAQRLQEF